MSSAGAPARILLVEDDPGDVLMITEALEEVTGSPAPHATVDTVGDGHEALDFLHRRGRHSQAVRPDVILLDLNMPRLDGRQLLAMIKTDPAFQDIPVVVLTTSNSPDDISYSYQWHANAYVTKPTDLDHLTNTVQQIQTFFTRVAHLPPHQLTA